MTGQLFEGLLRIIQNTTPLDGRVNGSVEMRLFEIFTRVNP
jgi:hypothetical protein